MKLTSTELTAPETVDKVVFPSTLVAPPLSTRESITRQVDAAVGDLPGGVYVRHSNAPGSIGNFSPGRRVNGIPFTTP